MGDASVVLERMRGAMRSRRFELGGVLGAGGMGVVFDAFDRELGRRVALKTLKDWSPERLFLLKREFRTLAELDHPNLIRIHELFAEEDQWFFTMELLEGDDFLTWLGVQSPEEPTGSTAPLQAAGAALEHAPQRPAPKADEARLRDGLRQLARGLATLHASGQVHRDLKPSNVRVTPAGRVVIMDFGLVGLADAPRAAVAARLGSPGYASPEQRLGDPVGPKSDLYSVGAILYRALSGQLPPGAGAVPASGPAELVALCAELLRAGPEERPSAEELLARLGAEVSPARASAEVDCFLGRARELAQLEGRWRAREPGKPSVLLVEGESGIGKTALCRRFLGTLPEALVLSGRCYERAQVPFNALDGAMDALSRHLADNPDAGRGLGQQLALLRRAFPVLGQAAVTPAASEAEVANPEALAQRVSDALRATFTALAGRGPVVLWVDDLQWADGDSLALIKELLAPSAGAPVLFLGAQRSRVGVPFAARLEREVESVRLEPLSPDEASALVARLGVDPDTADHGRVVAEGAGHPLYLRELALAARACGTSAVLDEALRERVAALDADARRLVEVVALAGEPISQSAVARASGADPVTLRRCEDDLRGKGLLQWCARGPEGWIDTFHDRVREAVVGGLEPALARQTHAALAQALEEEGAGEAAPDRLVRHLQGAGHLERAAAVALRAAQQARSALAYERASEFFRTALALRTGPDANRREITVALADCLAAAGRGLEAAEAYLAAKEGASAADRIELQRLAAEQLLGSGHLERGIEASAAVLAEIGEEWPRSRVAIGLEIGLARFKLSRLRRRRAPRVPNEQARLKLQAYRAVSIGLMNVDTFVAGHFHAKFAALALKAGSPEAAAEALAFESAFLALLGKPGDLDCLAEAEAVAQESADPEIPWLLLCVRGCVLSFQGQLRTGADLIDSGLEGWRRLQRDPWVLHRALFGWFQILDRIGAVKEVTPAFDRELRSASRRGDRALQHYVSSACSIALLARDDDRSLREVLARPLWADGASASFHRWLEAYAQGGLAMYSGDSASACDAARASLRRFRYSFIGRIPFHRSELEWLDGRLALGAHPDLWAARRSAVALGRLRRPHARVWALLLEGGVEAKAGDTASAQSRFAQAAEAARGEQMWLHHHVARLREGQLRGGRAGQELVDSSAAWMAAEGIRNVERMGRLIAPC